MTELDAVTWPLARAGEALEALARAGQLSLASRTTEIPAPPAAVLADGLLSRWIEATAAWLGVEAEPVEVGFGEVERLVRRAGPALLRVETGEHSELVALLAGGARRVTVLDGARVERRVSAAAVLHALRRPLEEKLSSQVDSLLAEAVPIRRRARARRALMAERADARRLGGCWLLRNRPGSSLLDQARRARLPRLLFELLVLHALEYCSLLAGWWAVAQGALLGRFDIGWLAAWLLLLLSVVPLRWLGARAQSRFVIAAGTLLKTRLLAGALRLEPNEIRREGAGQLLGRVLESSALETLGLSGGLLSVVALVELALCACVLSQGAGGLWHVLLLLVMVSAVAFLALRYFGRRRAWTDLRLSMTHDLVERMVGHRTRSAQEPETRWHDGEDQALERYIQTSLGLDRSSVALALLPNLWLFLGIAALGPSLLAASAATTPLAIALGGVLLGQRALESLASGVAQLAGAAISWQRAGPLVRAAARTDPAPPPSVAVTAPDSAPHGSVLLDAEDLRFRYRERGEPVLRGCSLIVRQGDRLLLEGPSGGGKSTLGSLLTGLRAPESGLLLLGGLDRHTLGPAAWRRRVASAPQFHENHVFGGTFAFNLLLGRAWPPSAFDLETAEALCRELELGPLLDRMPAGLQQMVGETGWQLSHGEKSRLYIARALLQNADIVALDESFAALDPETLERTLCCVLERARTLLVIAHP